MNKINDRDIEELSSYWVYQDINEKVFKVNGKRFKQIDYYNDKNNDNTKDAVDIKPTSYLMIREIQLVNRQ